MDGRRWTDQRERVQEFARSLEHFHILGIHVEGSAKCKKKSREERTHDTREEGTPDTPSRGEGGVFFHPKLPTEGNFATSDEDKLAALPPP